MRVDTLTVGMFQSNTFVVSCDRTNEAVLIDAGDEADRIIEHIESSDLRLKMIIATHGHIDHVAAIPEVSEAFSVPVFMHRDELPVYRSAGQQAALFGLEPPVTLEIDHFLTDGDTVRIGELAGRVIHTPGHSPGGVTIVFDAETPPKAFVGDVLFRGSIGRTDLMGASPRRMFEILKNVFLAMPDDMVVHPGHGPDTTIGYERSTNPFLLEAARS